MNQKKFNTILLSDTEVNHIIYSNKKGEYTIKGSSSFPYNSFDKLSLSNVLKEISQYVKNNKLTKLNIISDNVLKYQFILDRSENINLRFEALNRFKTTFDIQLSEYNIDFESYNFKNKIIVFVAGINKVFLDTILRSFKAHKFRLLFLEVDVIALKRLITSKYKNKIVMNIHMREDKTLFTVVFNDILFAFRELNFGFKNVINLLIEETKLSEEEIISNLNFENFPLSKALDKFTIELQRTIDFYNSQIRNEPINQFILTGKILQIGGIEQFLSQLFLINSERFNPVKEFFIETDVEILEKMTYYTEVLGTSLREI